MSSIDFTILNDIEIQLADVASAGNIVAQTMTIVHYKS